MEDTPISERERTPSSLADDLPQELIARSRDKSRMNAIILVTVFLLGVILPVASLASSPWNILAPVLALFPFFHLVTQRIRKVRASTHSQQKTATPSADSPPGMEPYCWIPKDPRDPRRYKPIG